MTKFYSIILILAVTFMVTNVYAQGGETANKPVMNHISTVASPQIDKVLDVLYDQTVGGNLNGYTSQDFEAAFDPYDNQAADDFTADVDWSVEEVVVSGTYSAGGPADGFNIYFYADNAGVPGTEVYNAPSQPYTYDAGTGVFTITLNTPAALPAGDYWVSVQCRMDFGTFGQWYWNQVDGAYGSIAQWRNPGGGFGTACSDWGAITSCIGAIGTDMYFALNGTPNPVEGFYEEFDGFIAGQQVACQDPVNWTTWNLTPCDPTTDAYISSNYSYSPSNSVVIVQNNDLVHPIGGYTSGKWYISFLVYIPAGKAGYFNTLGEFFGAPQFWSMECYFNAGGAGQLLNGGTVNFPWVEDTWQQVLLIVDLDLDQAEFLFGSTDPLTSYATWQWSRGGTYPLKIDANDFYGATANDEMYFDNYWIKETPPPIIPVELSSFTADILNGNVQLNWITSSETNNRGFEVQRSFEGEFHTIGFVPGNGTTTQQHTYSYIDNNVANGTYNYRLRQVDFDGTSEYSQIVEVVVNRPVEFNLAQNYPNPFNPSTKIDYALKVDSKVTLKVFDILGQEVASLLNENIAAGNHTVTFDASKLNSGVYLYKIEAAGADGSSFTSVKKMILTK